MEKSLLLKLIIKNIVLTNVAALQLIEGSWKNIMKKKNDTTLCASCQKKIDITKKSKIKGMINDIS